MQVQKEEMRKALLLSAESEFFTYGFEKSSVRRIVKAAGTTIGNFYNYFENKEELFTAIVKPAYTKFLSFLKGHDEADDLNELLQLDIEVLRQLIINQLGGVDDSFENTLVILIDGSQGSKYENIKEEIISFLSAHFMAHLEKASTNFQNKYYEDFSRTAAVGFIEGILDILRKNYSSSLKEALITEYILFFTLGTYALLKKTSS